MDLRLGFALLWLAVAPGGAAVPHHYTRAERYAGCLFGEAVPLVRRGAERERAMSAAANRCTAWAEGLAPADLRAAEADLRRALDHFERRGL